MKKIKTIASFIVLTSLLSLQAADAPSAVKQSQNEIPKNIVALVKTKLSLKYKDTCPTALKAFPSGKGYSVDAATRDFACFVAEVIQKHYEPDSFFKGKLGNKHNQAVVDHVYSNLLKGKYSDLLKANFNSFGGMEEFVRFLKSKGIIHPHEKDPSE